MAAAKKKKSELSNVLKGVVKQSGLGARELGRKAGIRDAQWIGMLYGATATIQKDAALRIVRVAKIDPVLLQPYLADKPPHGARKKRKETAKKKMAEIFKVPCPCCEGEGKINVRKV